MSDLIVTLIQAPLAWQQPEKNRRYFEAKIRALSEPTHLIVLPEMFTTGFTMQAAELAEPPDGATLRWMREMAHLKNCAITGSLIIEEDGKFYNRLYWAQSNGMMLHYDKRHLFRMVGEDSVYTAGKQPLTVEVNGWRIRPLICYDLRFPVWARNVDLDYDVLIYIANWPERRITHWRLLLQARAVENQGYVVGVNRIGKDGNGVNHTGDSLAADALGNILCDLHNREGVETVRLSRQALEYFRDKFPAWKDADRFKIET